MNLTSLSRREALRTLSLGAGALAFSQVGFIFPKQKEKLGVALVGLGYYSTDVLAPALLKAQHCYLAGIVTGTPSKAEAWKKQYQIPDKNIYDYQNFDKIADNPDIDIVYVVLPPSMHAEYVIRAAKAGKHVWCEKPMAPTAKECEDMIQACNNNSVKLSIGYRMHHEPNTRTLMGFSRNPDFGKVRLVSVAAGYFDSRKDHWKQKKALGGGAMYDMGVYPLQAARYSVGQEPIAVVAQQFTNRPDIYTEVDETTLFQLEFPNGAVAQCATSFGMSMNHLSVTYEKGWAKLEPFSGYSGVKGTCSGNWKLDAAIDNQQTKQMDDDALAIKNGEPMLVPGEEGLRDIRVVEAIYRSVKEGKRIVI